MERRNHARVAVNLKAALLDDQAMPVGCRVRDVSKGGMLLQHEHYNAAADFREGDKVEVRLSIRMDDERKVIPLSMTVKHVDGNGIGAEFLQPQSQLMTLVEPYRLDREDNRQAAAAQHEQAVNSAVNTTTPAPALTGTRASRRRSAIQRARVQFAESMQTAQQPGAVKEAPAPVQPPDDHTITGRGNRLLFYVGLLSLLAAIGISLFGFDHRMDLEKRMSALESGIDRQTSALTMLRARLAPADTRANELSSLSDRVEKLASAFAALENRMAQATQQTRSATALKTAMAQPAVAFDRPVTETVATAPPPAASSDEAPWVINLVSLYDPAAARQFTQKAQARGIPADIRQVAVKQRQVWRVQVSGFPTRGEASAYAEAHRKKLGLNSVWIFRR